jgi:uncharacterized protein (DUF2249 family)
LLATLHVFDARGISTSFRHAAIICALDLLAKGETLRLIDDHDPAHLLLQISARFRKAIVVHQVRNETGEIVVDLTRVSA